MVDFVVFGVIVWVIVAGVILFGAGDELERDPALVIAFWPITVPVFIVFGFVAAILSSIKYGLSLFKN